MIPRSRRIKTSLFRTTAGKTFRAHTLQVRIRAVNASSLTCFAVIVSKKTAKTAVVRNAIRRKVYGALDPFLSTIAPGFLCFIYPAREVAGLSAKVLEKELQTLFKEARIL